MSQTQVLQTDRRTAPGVQQIKQWMCLKLIINAIYPSNDPLRSLLSISLTSFENFFNLGNLSEIIIIKKDF